eukprot:TRINITY_DN10775_c0_g1_i1.p1 TRINITY_DN10775_c0_g1~~TRINITY_DN10775_c0_g1_i1.p1  ORF type:complete len:342 (+),score=32.25 TRINITY_DN10775_c0_g1_i1:85-1110(+)
MGATPERLLNITSKEQWGEWSSEMQFPSKEFPHLFFWYMVLSFLYLTVHCCVICWLRGHRKGSCIVLATWPRMVRMLVSFVIMIVILCPCALFVICHFSATLLCIVEVWPWMDAFEYVMCNMVAIGPMNNLMPGSTLGNFVDILVSALTLILSSTVIGFVSSTGFVTMLVDHLCAPRWSNLVGLILFILVSVLLLTTICSLILAAFDGVNVWDAFLYLAGIVCGFGNPITLFSPTTDEGFFFAALCSFMELAFGGAIIGILAGHPKIIGLLTSLEGTEESTTDQSDDPKQTTADESTKSEYEQLMAQMQQVQENALRKQEELEKRIRELEAAKGLLISQTE